MALAAAALLGACGAPPPAEPARAATVRAPAHAPAATARASGSAAPVAERVGWSYEVTAATGAATLRVDASFGPGFGDALVIEEGAGAFVRELEVAPSGAPGFVRAAAAAGGWAASCAAGCRVRYVFDLARAAEELDDVTVAGAEAGALFAPPSTWLVRPAADAADAPFTLAVRTPPDVRFVTGLRPSARGWAADVSDLEGAPYSAFGAFRVRTVAVEGGGVVEVAIAPGKLGVDDAAIEAWVARASGLVARLFGRPSIDRVALFVVPARGRGIGFARTLGNGGASILLPLGRDADARVLDREWVLVHELIHTGFPNLRREHAWMEEGLATYLEPIARARAGWIRPEEAWRTLARGLPRGLPAKDDRGLDRTPTWGRTYWGGALFWLLADVEIRKRSGGARGIDDAVRAIAAEGGDVGSRWDVAEVIACCDGATKTAVMDELYRAMATRPHPVDVEALLLELGVRRSGDGVVLDDAAPLAAIRRGIMQWPR